MINLAILPSIRSKGKVNLMILSFRTMITIILKSFQKSEWKDETPYPDRASARNFHKSY